MGGDATFSYDELDQRRTQTDGAGHTTRVRFDGEGLLLEQVEPNGAAYKTVYAYNALGSLTGVTDAAGKSWQYQYDNVQNLKQTLDPLGRETLYGYDALNRLRQVTQPLGAVTLYEYDANSNRTATVMPNGGRLTFEYDALERLTQRGVAAGTAGAETSPAAEFGYDGEGNLTAVTERFGSATRSYGRGYDARGRVETATDAFGNRTRYGWDAADNLTSFTDAAGRQASYAYDTRNRVQTATLSGGRTLGYEWHADGLLKQVTYGGGLQRAYGYDDADRVTQVTHRVAGGSGGAGETAEVERFDYAYDANSNRTQESRTKSVGATGAGQNLRTASYGYDLLNRVRSAQVTTGAGAGAVSSGLEWTYDAVGNRLSESGTAEATGQAVNRTYAYDGRNRLTTLTDASAGTSAYSYDANGNLLAIEQNHLTTSGYAYDAFDQLREVKDAQGQTVARYDYDFARRRTAKHFANSNAQLRYSYNETDNQVVNEFDELNRATASYDAIGGEVVRSEFANEGERFYFADALGSITTLSKLTRQPVNGAAQEVGERSASYAYDAWGTVTATVGSSANALGYTGQRHDGESGLLALGNGERYYAAGLGRFIQQDSWTGAAQLTQSLNRYSYSYNNPLKFTDPTGHIAEENRGHLAQAARTAGLNQNGDNNWWNITKNAAARTGYDVWDVVSFGALSRQEETVAQVEHGEITQQEFRERTLLNVGVSGAQLVLSVATGGAGRALTVGAGLVTRVGVGAGLAVGERFIADSLLMQTGFQREYSSVGTYVLAGVTGGVFGAASGRTVVAAQIEGRTSVRAGLQALKQEAQATGHQIASKARAFGKGFGEGWRSYRASGTKLTAGGLQDFAEQAEAGLRSGVNGVKTANKKSLLPSEGSVGTYDDLVAAGTKGDNITPHHIPSAKHMEQHGISKGEGISINMEHPFPGTGGRHRQTFTYGTQADVGLSPRNALGRGVRDVRKIYQSDGLYDSFIRRQLRELIRQNKTATPELFEK